MSLRTTRFELHEAIWRSPTTAVAAEFGVSDAWLRKVCNRNGLALPPRGYWQKKRAGHRLQAPPPLQGEDRMIEVTRRESSRTSARQHTKTVAALQSSVAALEALPSNSATVDQPKLSNVDLALDIASLEYDVNSVLRHRIREQLLAELTTKLLAAGDLDGQRARWLSDLQAEVRKLSPCRVLEVLAMSRLSRQTPVSNGEIPK